MDLNHRWSLFKSRVQEELTPRDYEGWLSHLQLVEVSPERIVIAGLPHPLFRDDILRNYDHILRRILSDIFPEVAPVTRKKIEYCIGERRIVKVSSIQAELPFHESSGAIPPVASTPSAYSSQAPVAPKKAFDGSANAHKVVPFKPPTGVEAMPALFNPKYTLDTLVVGSNNQLAYEAGCRIVHHPGMLFNPLFIYGELGLGKTHLLEAIGQAIQKVHPELNVVYTTAESFVNDFVAHVQQQRMGSFRQCYRNADVLLIDDLDMIANTKSCQEELLHTVNALKQREKQIIVTSHKLPGDLKNLDKTLASRLESGLIADIKAPDLETRVRILETKARRDHIPLPGDVAHFIAQHIYSNVRKMEGALIRLGAHASLLRQKISLEFTRSILGDMLDTAPTWSQTAIPPVSSDKVERVFQKVCSMSQLSKADLQSNRRESNLVKARQVGMYLLKELTDLSLAEIGERFGNRTHSAIHHSIQQIKQRMETDPELRQQVITLKDDLEEVPDRKSAIQTKLFSSGGK